MSDFSKDLKNEKLLGKGSYRGRKRSCFNWNQQHSKPPSRTLSDAGGYAVSFRFFFLLPFFLFPFIFSSAVPCALHVTPNFAMCSAPFRFTHFFLLLFFRFVFVVFGIRLHWPYHRALTPCNKNKMANRGLLDSVAESEVIRVVGDG